MKRTILRPTFYNSFKCIGSECESTCCKGWRVNIDKETYQNYENLKPSPLKNKLLQSIELSSNESEYDYASFKMQKKACPLLTKEGLCSIHKDLGESYLCYTCSMYPRTVTKVKDVLEFSFEFSCPEAAKIALSQVNGIEFEIVDEEPGKILVKPLKLSVDKDNSLSYLLDIRNFVIFILQERSLSIEERLMLLGLFFEQLDEAAPSETLVIINSFTNELKNGDIKQILDIKYSSELFVMIGSEILLEFSKLKFSTTRFANFCFNSIMSYVDDEKCSISDIAQVYEYGKKTYYDELMSEYDYMLENYLVMIIYSKVFPYGFKTYISAYKTLVIRYLLFKLMLVGNALYNEKMTVEDVYSYTYSSYKEMEHGNTLIKLILRIFNKYEVNELNKLFSLIKG